MGFHHLPVLLSEVLQYLAPRDGGRYMDGTVGGGGHSAAILAAAGAKAQLCGLDQDPEALTAAEQRLAEFNDQVTLVHTNFRHLRQVAERFGLVGRVDGILLDLGVSSHQIDQAERGFVYRMEGPLDMRMDPRGPLTAAHILNTYPVEEIARILWEYGEERWGKRIAEFVVQRRAEAPLTTTSEVVDLIRAAIPAAARQEGGHPAKRTFQALRIAVNDELGALRVALPEAVAMLAPGGRLVVISFHSLEDRLVKQFFAEQARGCICPPDLPVCGCGHRAKLTVLTKKPVLCTAVEAEANPRARSAKLRAAQCVG